MSEVKAIVDEVNRVMLSWLYPSGMKGWRLVPIHLSSYTTGFWWAGCHPELWEGFAGGRRIQGARRNYEADQQLPLRAVRSLRERHKYPSRTAIKAPFPASALTVLSVSHVATCRGTSWEHAQGRHKARPVTALGALFFPQLKNWRVAFLWRYMQSSEHCTILWGVLFN